MSITWQEVEAAGYKILETGKITGPDGKQAKQYELNGRMNVQVTLPRQAGKSKPWTYVRLHIMVASKFVPNPNGYKNVAFKRGKSYRASNLVWSTPTDAVRTQAKRDKQYALMMLNDGLIHWREARDLGIGEERAYKIWRKVNATV
ncbi:hypothetical protein PEA_00080 [Erwinia phage phiEa1H]|uniref:HNH endonuclease n=1 Tax=Erwinia phage phiEa100 TaxID=925983 RepID=E5AGH0_9CAUD|nr:hypothetical protein G172_gp09 [Erwinia phage phiEa100]CBX44469.1 hypothetical protein PEA_00080 [Erwinia phage phiEa1H]CBX45072.1 hypothetical protein P100_00090 [Erwinia phage phiEa100]